MGTVTRVINESSLAEALDDTALQGMLYQELKIIARSKLRNHNRVTGLNTTSLVHDAFIKLNQSEQENETQVWEGRKHFYATAALVMRQILVDQARKRLAAKRGEGRKAADIDEVDRKITHECEELVTINDALDDMQKIDMGLAELTHLKFFVGMTSQETAELLNCSKKTIDREWNKAKALLKRLVTARD